MSSHDDIIYKSLAAMDSSQLNSLDIKDYPPHQRKFINRERVRRKRAVSKPERPTPDGIDGTKPPKPHEPADTPKTPQDRPLNDFRRLGPYTPPKPKRRRGSENLSLTLSGIDDAKPDSWFLFDKCQHKINNEAKGVTFVPLVKDSVDRGGRKSEINLAGKLSCPCSEKGWGSQSITAIIREYPMSDGRLGYSIQVFNQECKSCGEMADMDLDVNICVERVVRRLKIWKGEFVPFRPDKLKKLKHDKRVLEKSQRGKQELDEDESEDGGKNNQNKDGNQRSKVGDKKQRTKVKGRKREDKVKDGDRVKDGDKDKPEDGKDDEGSDEIQDEEVEESGEELEATS
ncbi:hypothetical protein TWF481_006612 [Arthrobotrys musiformis]|uniref:3CxxC-type domain-containing protein n=1 Tax=Arthrobotrys musiformis TaxID=47236 RepID=A0AAV9WB25_9PEZI